MNHLTKLALLFVALVIVVIVIDQIALRFEAKHIATEIIEEVETVKPTLSHRQQTWLSVLEWCESRGDPNAINANDLDGTPSYGAFQFKPSTLKHYSQKYGIELGGNALWDARYDTIASTSPAMDYDFQRAVVTQMILNHDDIDWQQQFPDCVERYGEPPHNKKPA